MKLLSAQVPIHWPRMRTVSPPRRTQAVEETVAERPKQFDEQGRELVFSFPPAQAHVYIVDRDRIFEYLKKRRKLASGRSQPLLPDANVRRYVRAQRNAADFFADVRDLQTHADIELRD
jgi:hypothetical protein